MDTALESIYNQQPTFKSYREYIRFLANLAPEYEWLKQFLDTKVDKPQTSTLILECSSRSADRMLRSFPDFTFDRLANCPANIAVRVIMLSYPDMWLLDRDTLDAVAFTLDLEPVILWRFLDHDDSYRENHFCPVDKPNRIIPTLSQLPSTFRSLQVDIENYENGRLMAAIIKPSEPSGCTNVLLLYETRDDDLQTHNSRDRLSMYACSPAKISHGKRFVDQYQKLVESWSKKLMKQAEQYPIRFILPCVRYLQLSAWDTIEKSRLRIQSKASTDLTVDWKDGFKYEHAEIGELQSFFQRTNTTLNDFRRFSQNHESDNLPETKAVVSDFELLLELSKQLRDAAKEFFVRRTAVIAIQESRKSIQMANSVRILTQIAFFFVPASFASSIFGANMREMGSGTVPLWVFIVTVLVISTITMIGWGIHTGSIQATVAVRYRWLQCLVFLALRTPYHAALLLLCTMFEANETLRSHLEYLGLLPILIAGKPAHLVAVVPYFPRAEPGDSSWQAFKRDRLHEVALFTKRKDWRDDLFHRRALSYVVSKIKRRDEKRMEQEHQLQPNTV